jgi:alpha-tubulin suppressor-like RCC1 family protein
MSFHARVLLLAGVITAGLLPVSLEAARAAGVRELAAGTYHSCAVDSGGAVKCWGSNGYGQLGDGTTTSRATPVTAGDLESGIVAVQAGSVHTCALTGAGTVKCWGDNQYGQLGDGTTTERHSPVDVVGVGGVVALALGSAHTCALTAAGAVRCWGFNGYGALGDGTTADRNTAVEPIGLSAGVSQVTAGASHTCALQSDGSVTCWGGNTEGEAGDGTVGSPRVQPLLSSVTGVTAVTISAGLRHTCALTTDGGLKCWGGNSFGQLGDGSTTDRPTPVDVLSLTSDVAQVAGGLYHTCAVTLSGHAWCWGFNNHGQIGDGTTTNRPVPVEVAVSSKWLAAMVPGGFHTLALMADGAAKGWGYNSQGQLGDGTTTSRTSPPSSDVFNGGELPSSGEPIAAGESHTCRITAAGGVQCWGDNEAGQLGNGTTTSSPFPVDVPALPNGVVSLAVGNGHTCALTAGGGLKCWGSNLYGQLGDGTTTNRTTPTDVPGFTSGVLAVAAGWRSTCVLTASGGIICWGVNSEGQFGSLPIGLTPVAARWVTGLTTGATKVSLGYLHACAMTRPGGVACWGSNTMGQLGDGTVTTRRVMPRGVSGLASGVARLSVGSGYACVVTSAGGVKCWGSNAGGLLGDGTTTDRSTPVDVVGLASGAVSVSAGEYATCALTEASGVKCWGRNFHGTVGDGTTTDRWSPVGVAGLASGVSALTAGSAHVCAVMATGRVKCWGWNEDGQLGIGLITDRLAPRTVRTWALNQDFDRDSLPDVAVYRPASGTWFSLDSSSNNSTMSVRGWGDDSQGDIPVLGDFDGVGAVDPAVYRPSTGTWLILQSYANYTTWTWFGWGAPGDIPVPADYDGDCKTDGAVFRPSTGTWYIRPSGGGAPWSIAFGSAGDIPLPGHYDGDGKADLVIYRPSTGTWFVLTSSSGYTSWWHAGFGVDAEGDVPAPGDYDGDGRMDLCVYRPSTGTWFVLESHTNYSTVQSLGWGAPGDVPVPADYDDDGITDAAVYRPSTGTWYVRPSGGGTPWSVVFGQTGDVPLLKVR